MKDEKSIPNGDEYKEKWTKLRIRNVEDARILLDYSIKSGIEPDDEETVKEIERAEARLLANEIEIKDLNNSSWSSFDRAYKNLSAVMKPVTASSLKATSFEYAKPTKNIFGRERVLPEGIAFSRLLWMLATLILIFIVSEEIFKSNVDKNLLAERAVSDPISFFLKNVLLGLTAIEPFLYGALGAITYLLKSCHVYINLRQFNLLKKSEYFNRIFIGLIAGGTIMLFSEVIIEDPKYEELTGAALAFLVGYSSDFFFTILDRLISAITPKIGSDGSQKQSARPVKPVDIPALLEKFETLDPGPEKEMYRKTIDAYLKKP